MALQGATESLGGEGGSSLPIRFVYSLMTLQHNPPELMSLIIGRLCAVLAIGGYGFVHAPYHVPREQRVRGDAPVMQMHAISRKKVARVLRRSGCELIATLDGEAYDRCGGGIQNAHYLFRKTRRAEDVEVSPISVL